MIEKPRTYKDLLFWKSAFETAKLVLVLSRKLPQTVEVKIILNQLIRSVMSIGANIAEGYGRLGKKEFLRFLQVALGSANETEYWLMLLKECTSYTSEVDKIIDKNMENIKMLAASIRTLRHKQ